MRTLGILRLLSSVLICLVVSPRVMHSQTGNPEAIGPGAINPAASNPGARGSSADDRRIPPQLKRDHLISALQALPLQFEENKGQADGRARFLARGAGYTLLLNPDGLALNLAHTPNSAAQSLSMHLLGAQTAVLAGREQTATRTNYYVGRDPGNWHLDVRSYRSVAYTGIYKGIDLVYHGSGSQLEYDFVVAPGADPGQVRMRFDGLKPTLQGRDLSFEGQNQLSVRALRAFQMLDGEKKPVDADWDIQGDQASIHLGPYDRSRELIIDPVFYYGSFIGGVGFDSAVSIVPAATANIFYIALSTASASIQEPVQQGEQQAAINPNATGTETLILELDATGSTASPDTLPVVDNATYIGGASGTTVPTAMVADATFNLYVTGTTTNPSSFPQLGTQVCAAACPSFVAKLNASLGLQYSFGLPATSSNGIAVDASGDAYLTGSAAAGALTIPSADTSFQTQITAGTALTTGNHAFLLELDPNGATLFSSYIGGSGADQGTSIALFGNSVYVAGQTTSADFPTTSGVAQPQYGGSGSGSAIALGTQQPASLNGDAFVIAVSTLSTAPTLTFSTYLGGSGDDYASSIAVDYLGNTVILGSTTSVYAADSITPLTFFITTYKASVFEGVQAIAVASSDTLGSQLGFVYGLAPDGSLRFLNLLGGNAGDVATGNSLALDSAGVIYAAGATDSTFTSFLGGNVVSDFDLPSTGTHTFLAQIDPTGNYLLEATLGGGSGPDQPNSLNLSTGLASIAGYTSSENFFYSAHFSPDPGNLQDVNNGFFVQELTTGFCNLQLTSQVGPQLTFSGPCSPGTAGGILTGTATDTNGAHTLGPTPLTISTSNVGSVSLDLTPFSGQISLALTFSAFTPIGAIGEKCNDAFDDTPDFKCPKDKSVSPPITYGGGLGTLFNTSNGALTVALSCTSTNCTYNTQPNTVLVGQPVTLNAVVIDGVPNTVTWSSSQGTFTGPNPSTSITFTPGGTGGQVVVMATPVANPSLSPTPTITLATLEPTSVTFSSNGPFPYSQTNITVSVASSAGPTFTPTGTVTYQVDGGDSGSGTLPLIAGSVSLPLTALSAGSHTLYVAYPGISSFAGSSNTLTFTVSQAVLTVTAVSPSPITFDQAIPALTYTITGFLNGDTTQVVDGTAALTTTATSSSAPGNYPITFSTEGLVATNYTFTYVNGTLTINVIGAAPAPVISPAGGTFTAAQTAILTDAVASAKIYYTSDGTAPTTSSTLYAGPLTIAASETIRAIAVATGYTTSNISSAPFTVSAPTLSSLSISFGNISEGTSSATQSIVLTNPGANPLSGLTVALSGANGGDFTLGSGTTCGVSLAASASCSVAVAFTPTAIGPRSGALLFSYSGTGSPLTVALGGIGLPPLTITSSAAQLVAGTTFQFAANETVTWTASAGTITASGFFTAPNPPPAPAVITVTAMSVANPQIIATAQVTIVPVPAVVVPPTNTLPVGGSVSIPITIGAGTGIPGESLLLACVPATLPSGVTCAFTPNPVINAAGGSTVTLELTSNALSASLPVPNSPWKRYPLDGSVIAIAGCIFFISRKKVDGKKVMMLAVMLASGALLSMTACGTSGSFSNRSQQGFVTGAYTINVSVSGDSPGTPDFNQTLTIFQVKVTIQ